MNYTVPQDLAGLPACSVRVGFDRDGIPVAVQVTAARGREDRTLRVARWLQTAFAEAQAPWPAVARL
jgi:aspartyl-tRNA(Asn)/glutamyl-tRNA(Gln) amidotransferase subunit A